MDEWLTAAQPDKQKRTGRQTADGQPDRRDSQPLECSTISINLSHDTSCRLMTEYPYLNATQQYCDQPLLFASPVPAVYLMKLLLTK